MFFEALKKYAVFRGRARRKEYWQFLLLVTGVVLAIEAVVAIGEVAGIIPLQYWAAAVAMTVVAASIIPGLGVGVRRLHDINRSGLWMLIAVFPIIGHLVLFLLATIDGTADLNAYGPDPKGRGRKARPAFVFGED